MSKNSFLGKNRLHEDDLIDDDTFKYLISNSDPKAGRFYILPKIHKQGNPGCPIISSNGHPTDRISEFVDYYLKSLVQSIPSYIKDTAHFLLQLEQMGPLPDNAILVTLDDSSLYTNIPHNEGIEACRHFLNTRQDKTLPTECMPPDPPTGVTPATSQATAVPLLISIFANKST